MTDSVRCSLDSNQTFTCEVHLDSDFEAPSAAPTPAAGAKPTITAAPPPAEPLAAASPAADPAVANLVRSFTGTNSLPMVDAPLVTGSALAECSSNLLGLPLAFKSAGPLGILGGFKTGYDLGKCLALERVDAREQATFEQGVSSCEAQGGKVDGVIDNKIMCNMTAVSQ